MGERESVGRTLAVAGGVALICSLLVSAAVYWLRPFQLAYRSLEQNRAVLTAAGLARVDEALSDREIVERFLVLEARIVDLDADAFAEASPTAAAGYDYRDAIDDPEQSVAIAAEHDVAGLGRRPRRMPAYVLRDAQGVELIVVPVYGRGMWSTVYGYVALGPDLSTVVGVRFHEHGETPGIGDRIQSPAWIAQWAGKRMFGNDGTLALRVGTPAGDSAASDRIDAITGATVTVTAVDRLVRYWFGVDGYGPFLANLRARGH